MRGAVGCGLSGCWLLGCARQKSGTGFATRLEPAPKGVRLDPPPPNDLFWLRLASAKMPPRTPGGQLWDEVGGWPDPYAVLRIGGKVALRTSPVADSLDPAWPDAPGGNFEIAPGERIEVSLHDNDALNDRPMGRAKLDAPKPADLHQRSMRAEIGGIGNKGHVLVEIEAPHALFGLGFDFSIYETRVVVSRVLRHSPAGRAGMKPKDEIISVDGVGFAGLDAREIRGVFHAIEAKPVAIIVKHPSGSTETFPIGEGPCYPLHAELGPVA